MSGKYSLLALAGAVALTTGCNRLTGPSPVDARWDVYETQHFLLHVRPGSFANQNVDRFGVVLEDQYTVSVARLEGVLERKLFGFLYNPGEGGLAGGDNREGVAYPLTDAFKVGVAPPLESNFAVMAHEANHVIAEQILGRPGTSFVNEGLASALLSERYHQFGPTFAHAWVASRSDLPALSQLVDDEAWSGFDHDIAYNSSASFVAYLLDVHGPARFRRLWRASSGAFASQFGEVYGLTLAEAEVRWKAYARGAR
jgi:hypothetical protein